MGEEHRGVVGGRGVGPRVVVELVLEERVEVGRGLRRWERLQREPRWRSWRGWGKGERRAGGGGPDAGAEDGMRVLKGAQGGLRRLRRRVGAAGEAQREQRGAGAARHGAAPAVLRAARRAGAPLGRVVELGARAAARGIHRGRREAPPPMLLVSPQVCA